MAGVDREGPTIMGGSELEILDGSFFVTRALSCSMT